MNVIPDLTKVQKFFEPKLIFKAHVCRFIPALNKQGQLIAVCEDEGCHEWITFDEIVERINATSG